MGRWLLALAWLASGLLLARPAEAQAAPESVARQVIEAENRGDVEAAVALFQPDAEIETSAGGLCHPVSCTGTDAIRREVARRVAVHIRSTIREMTVIGSTVISRLEIVTDNIRAAGVERAVALRTDIVRDGRISYSINLFDESDPETARYLDATPNRRPPLDPAGMGTPGAVAGQFTAAVNQGDVARALVLFQPDARFETTGGGLCRAVPCIGREAIRAEVLRRVAVHSVYTVRGTRVYHLTTVSATELVTAVTRAAGVERIRLFETYVVPDGRIAFYRSQLDLTDAQTARYLAYVDAQGGPATAAAGAAGPVAQLPRALPRTGEAPAPLLALAAFGIICVMAGIWRRGRPAA